MKTIGLWCLILVILLVVQDADAWGRRRASRRVSFGRRMKSIGRRMKSIGRKIRTRIGNFGRGIRRRIDFGVGAAKGSRDMLRAYKDMRNANFIGSDKYFHARGNYDAQKHGPGGKWAAEKLSNAREGWQGSISGRGAEDSAADQVANKWGRNGGDPNKYRPKDLPPKY